MPKFDTTTLRNLRDCLQKAADAADAKTIEYAAQNERNLAQQQQRRAQRNRLWVANLDLALKELEKVPKQSSGSRTQPVTEYSADFESFWTAYPRKKSKADAWKAWNQMNCGPLAVVISNAIARLKNSSDWKRDNGEFIPYPATWIRAAGWLDEANTPPPSGASTQQKTDPEGWKEFCMLKRVPYKAFQFAASYLKDEFRAALKGGK